MKQAVILAAGEGRRLMPFSVNKPKAMLSVAGKPIIRYIIEALTANGIRNIIIIVGYQKEKIYDYLGDGRQFGVEITFITQGKQLGSAHALSQAKNMIESEFLVLGGNRLITSETISPIAQATSPAVLITKAKYPSLYGVVSSKNGKITGIVEKPIGAQDGFINTGIYAFNKALFKYIEGETGLPTAVNNMLADGMAINAVETGGVWLDVVYPWDMLNLNSMILRNIQASQSGIVETCVQITGQVAIGKNTVIHSNSYIAGPVTIGKGCEIGPNVCIFPDTSIGDNVVIAPFTELRNCVIGDDVRIASGAALEDTVIDNGTNAGSHFTVRSEVTEVKVDEEHHTIKTGAMIGSSCQIGNMVTARAGTVVGNGVRVNSMKVIGGNVPEKAVVV